MNDAPGVGSDSGAAQVRQEAIAASADDFDENGALTRAFLLRRGYCCREGCTNCPYGFVAA